MRNLVAALYGGSLLTDTDRILKDKISGKNVKQPVSQTLSIYSSKTSHAPSPLLLLIYPELFQVLFLLLPFILIFITLYWPLLHITAAILLVFCCIFSLVILQGVSHSMHKRSLVFCRNLEVRWNDNWT